MVIHGLLLVLCSEITPGRTRKTFCGDGVQTGAGCMPGRCFNLGIISQTSGPIPIATDEVEQIENRAEFTGYKDLPNISMLVLWAPGEGRGSSTIIIAISNKEVNGTGKWPLRMEHMKEKGRAKSDSATGSPSKASPERIPVPPPCCHLTSYRKYCWFRELTASLVTHLLTKISAKNLL